MSADELDPEDRKFLAGYDPEAYERLSVAVDVALVTVIDGRLRALTVKRPESPYRGWQALPGGFLGVDESPERAAARVLAHKTGLEGVYLEQLYTFGEPGRDPRTRVLSIAHYALVPASRLNEAPGPGSQLAELVVSWEGEKGGPAGVLIDGAPRRLAFDHARILGMVVQRLRGKIAYAPVGYELLGDTFTLRELQEVHEAILGRAMSKPAFRRRMLATGDLTATGEMESDVAYRPAELYRFTGRPG